MNPFGFLFASRYLAEDTPDFLKFMKEKETYTLYCLESKSDILYRGVAPHYVSINFTISKKTKRGDWTEEHISYETHYIGLSYFSTWLSLSAEEYIDINGVQTGIMPFKYTNKHPLYQQIVLNASKEITYNITIDDICYYGIFAVKEPTYQSMYYNDYVMMVPSVYQEMVEEYDPMQWY